MWDNELKIVPRRLGLRRHDPPAPAATHRVQNCSRCCAIGVWTATERLDEPPLPSVYDCWSWLTPRGTLSSQEDSEKLKLLSTCDCSSSDPACAAWCSRPGRDQSWIWPSCVTVTGDSQGPLRSLCSLPLTAQIGMGEEEEGEWGRVCVWGGGGLVARIRSTDLKREREENREVNDSAHKQAWLLRHHKYVTDQWRRPLLQRVSSLSPASPGQSEEQMIRTKN